MRFDNRVRVRPFVFRYTTLDEEHTFYRYAPSEGNAVYWFTDCYQLADGQGDLERAHRQFEIEQEFEEVMHHV
jgi:hypothetical protein